LRSQCPSGMCAKLRTVAAINNSDHAPQSLYYCLFAPRLCGVVLRAHPVRGESHIQGNANGEVATTSPRFYNEPHPSHVLFVEAASGTTFTSWSQHHFVATEIPSGMCAKFRNVAASNNRDHAPQSLYYCLFAPLICV